MRRRLFLKLASAAWLPRVRPIELPQQQAPTGGPRYSDSEGHTDAELQSLHDGKTTDGGVEYAP